MSTPQLQVQVNEIPREWVDISQTISEVESFPFLQTLTGDLSRAKMRNSSGEEEDVIVNTLRVSWDETESNGHVIKCIFKLVCIWNDLTHPGILTTYGVHLDGPRISLVHPSCFRKDIIKYIEDTKDISPGVIFTFVKEIVAAVAHLHQNGVYVGDLSGRSIVIDDKGHAVIADIGIEFIRRSSKKYGHITPTCRWQPRELLFLDDDSATPIPTAESDVYSVAMIILELHGRPPYNKVKSNTQFIWKMGQGTLERLTKPDNMAEAVWLAIEPCFQSQPSLRPTAQELHRRLELIMLE